MPLALPTTHDTASLLAFLRPRAIPGVEEVTAATYRRTAGGDGGPLVVEVSLRSCGPGVDAAVRTPGRPQGPGPAPSWAIRRLRHLLDADGDPVVVDAALSSDPVLAPLVAARPGLRRPGAWDGFEVAVRVVVGQQVSVAGASTLMGRLVARLGRPLPRPEGRLTHLFPTPAAVAEADLTTVGLTRQRARALKALAGVVASGDLILDPSSPPAEVRARLLALPGVGRWSATMIAMRALGDPDAFPETDLGVRRGAQSLGLPNGHQLRRRAECWRPWRAYATLHLWAAAGAAHRAAPARAKP